MTIKTWTYLIIVLFVAAFLRFYKLSSVPPSVDWDEAAIGWNAKTIFHTRLDEYGTKLPLAFRSFGDYKAPVYIYLTSPLVGILGMNELSVRLVSILAGIGSIVIIFFLTEAILENVQMISVATKHQVALLSSLLLAVTPWHILLSRPAFEPNLALFFILLGTWWLVLGIKKHPVWLPPATLSFVLSLYTYHSPKIFVPLFLLGMAFIYREQLFEKKRIFLVAAAIILGIVTLFPLEQSLFFAEGGSRFQGTSVFFTKEGKRTLFDLNLVFQLGKNYAIHYSPKFLFGGAQENPRIQMREIGPLLLIEAPFLILGLLFLFNKRKEKWAQFLGWWFIVGPVAATVGMEVPHPIRAFNLLPALTIIVALGISQSLKLCNWRFLKTTIALLFTVNLGYFLSCYFVAYPIYAAPDWQYGYKEVAKLAKSYEDQVDKIIVTSTYGQPHTFMLFYQNRDPQQVFWGGMIKYLYRDLNWDEDQNLKNVLLVGSPKEIPTEAKGLVKEIKFPNGEVAFRIIKT